MITTSLYLDNRHHDALAAVKIRLSQNRKSAYISTGISISAGCWDAQNKIVIGLPEAAIYNSTLAYRLAQINMKILPEQAQGTYAGKSISEIRDLVLVYLGDKKEENTITYFTSWYRHVAATKNPSTALIYRNTLRKLEQYCAHCRINADRLRFEDITPRWLQDFDTWMSGDTSINSRNIHFRNIKHVFNCAIDEELTTAYPFRKFKHKTEETAKRALSIEELRTLWSYPCEPWQQRWIDVFKLTFYLRGINLADLFYLTPDNYAGGRIVYRRAKTGKLYSVKVEPEAAEIIEKYCGTKYLLSWGDTYKHHRSLTHRINLVLKSIGEVERKGLGGKKFRQPLFPDLSLSDARHTVATLMADLDIPNETIAATLGHSYGNRTTAIYIKPNQNKVDKAMRHIIDYVLEKEEGTTSPLLTNN